MPAALKTEDIPGVEIFDVGTWNGDPYDAARLAAIVKNTLALKAKGYHEAPVKIGHSETQSFLEREGYPAAGWIGNLYMRGTKLMADFVRVPARIAALIKVGAYRKVSAEIWPSFGLAPDGITYGPTLKAIAILGEEIPAVAGLADIEKLYGLATGATVYPPALAALHARPATERIVMTFTAGGTKSGLETTVDDGDSAIPGAKPGADTPAATHKKTEAKMDIKALATALGLDPEKATEADCFSAVSTMRQTVAKFAEMEREVKTFREERETEKAEAAVEKAITDKRLAPAQKDWALAYARKDAEGFKTYVEKTPAIFSGERGSATDDPTAEGNPRQALYRLAQEYRKANPDVDFRTAIRAVQMANPALAREAAHPEYSAASAKN